MSQLEKILDKAKKNYQAALLKRRPASQFLKNAAELDLVDMRDLLFYYESLIADATRLAAGEEIGLVVHGKFNTMVEEFEEIWDLVIDHAVQVQRELREDEPVEAGIPLAAGEK